MGQFEYELKSLADEQLLSGLASIVSRRNQITAEFLAYLAELDERQLFLDLGFSSLFEYCVEKLGLCESTAGRHIGAARVCRSHPEVFAMVASGALHASALSLLRKHLTVENAAELFTMCSRRSARQVEELLAARFPRPDVRDLVRRLPVRVEVTLDVESPKGQASEKAPVEFSSREPSTVRASAPIEALCQLPVAPTASEPLKARRIEPLSADRFGVHFTADGDFCALLERVRGLAGHRLPGGDLMTLLKRGLEAYERELEKERFAVAKKTRRHRNSVLASAELSPPEASKATSDLSKPKRSITLKRSRYCPAAVTRAVFLRDGNQCTYVSPDGRRCSARRCLELDHVEPFRGRWRFHDCESAAALSGAQSMVCAAVLWERSHQRSNPTFSSEIAWRTRSLG